LPPTLVAKVEELAALYKQAQELSGQATAADLTDLEGIEKRLVAAQPLAEKIQALGVEIAAAEAQLSPEQRAEFARQFADKLKPMALTLPAIPAPAPPR
jgi:hypothetical protein